MELTTQERFLQARFNRLLAYKLYQIKHGIGLFDPLDYLTESDIVLDGHCLSRSYQFDAVVVDLQTIVDVVDTKGLDFRHIDHFFDDWTPSRYTVRENSRKIARAIVQSIAEPLILSSLMEAQSEYRIHKYAVTFV